MSRPAEDIIKAGEATRWPELQPGEKSTQVRLRVPESWKAQLEQVAEAKGQSLSDWIRQAIVERLERDQLREEK